jgi:hypothetical protein
MRLLYLLVDETAPSPERVDRRLREGQAVETLKIRLGPAPPPLEHPRELMDFLTRLEER